MMTYATELQYTEAYTTACYNFNLQSVTKRYSEKPKSQNKLKLTHLLRFNSDASGASGIERPQFETLDGRKQENLP